MKKILFLIVCLLLNLSTAQAKNAKEIDDPEPKRTFEVQFERFNGHMFDKRKVNNYNLHVFQKVHDHRALSVYRGLTFMRATGYIRTHNNNDWFESGAVGLGPAMMLRWTQPISGKLHVAGDFTGSFLFCDHAHPANGRAYGFMWRVGPRLIWQYNDDDSISAGYSVSHFSNGTRKSHNPGYNSMGFTVNFQHKF